MGRNELNKLTLLPMCGFIAQLVEHRTGIAEVMGSNPVEALIFFRLLLSNCLNWKIYCDDHTSLSELTFFYRIFQGLLPQSFKVNIVHISTFILAVDILGTQAVTSYTLNPQSSMSVDPSYMYMCNHQNTKMYATILVNPFCEF